MPEVQTSTVSGEMTQRFIEFIMMHAQQASLFLGRLPHPQTGKAEVHLEVAKLFIDQLEMIQEKTRGNLSNEEAEILRRILSDLQMAYVQVSAEPVAPASPADEPAKETPAEASAADTPAAAESDPASAENKKKFTKSYGA